jgi:FtsP/CotA-like multicopper oxidase with cupredoxin domain
MSFTVTAAKGAKMPDLKGVLNPTLSATTFPTIPQPLAANRRSLVLVEVDGNDGPFSGTINGLPFMANATEVVTQGSTEDWDYINLSVDSHPMHNHLAAHQLVSRQTFNVTSYKADWLTLNGVTELPFPEGHVLKSLPVGPYLTGTPILPAAWERGWKDTTVSPPGSVTTIRVRFAKKNGKAFSFNPTIGPGEKSHCKRAWTNLLIFTSRHQATFTIATF